MARIGFHGFKAGTSVELVLHKFGQNMEPVEVVRAGPVNWGQSVVIPDVPAPGTGSILDWQVSPQQGGNIEISYEVAEEISAYVVASTLSTSPSASQFVAGQQSDGTAAPWAFETPLTVSQAPIAQDLPVMQGDFYFHVMSSDGESLAVSGPISIDTSAPEITLAGVGYNEGADDIRGTIETSEYQGTIYAGYWPKAFTPSVSDMKAGSGSLIHTTYTPTGSQEITFSELDGAETGTLYKLYAYQEDPAGNVSQIVSSADAFIPVTTSLTLDEGAPVSSSVFTDAGTVVIPIRGLPTGQASRKVLLVVGVTGDPGFTFNSVTTSEGVDNVYSYANSQTARILEIDTEAADIDVSITISGGRFRGYFVHPFVMGGGVVHDDRVNAASGGIATQDVGGAALAGDIILAVNRATNDDVSWTGAELLARYPGYFSGHWSVARGEVPADSNNYVMRATNVNSGYTVALHLRGQ